VEKGARVYVLDREAPKKLIFNDQRSGGSWVYIIPGDVRDANWLRLSIDRLRLIQCPLSRSSRVPINNSAPLSHSHQT